MTAIYTLHHLHIMQMPMPHEACHGTCGCHDVGRNWYGMMQHVRSRHGIPTAALRGIWLIEEGIRYHSAQPKMRRSANKASCRINGDAGNQQHRADAIVSRKITACGATPTGCSTSEGALVSGATDAHQRDGCEASATDSAYESPHRAIHQRGVAIAQPARAVRQPYWRRVAAWVKCSAACNPTLPIEALLNEPTRRDAVLLLDNATTKRMCALARGGADASACGSASVARAARSHTSALMQPHRSLAVEQRMARLATARPQLLATSNNAQSNFSALIASALVAALVAGKALIHVARATQPCCPSSQGSKHQRRGWMHTKQTVHRCCPQLQCGAIMRSAMILPPRASGRSWHLGKSRMSINTRQGWTRSTRSRASSVTCQRTSANAQRRSTTTSSLCSASST